MQKHIRGWVTRHRTVWSPGVLDKPEDNRVRSLLQITLPIVDIIIMLFGLAVAIYGAPVLYLLFPHIAPRISIGFGSVIFLAAWVALVGLVFVRVKLELVAKFVLLILLFIYPLLLTIGTFDIARAAIGILCFIPTPMIMWRIADIGREFGRTPNNLDSHRLWRWFAARAEK